MPEKSDIIVSSSVIDVARSEPEVPKSSWKGWLWDSADVSKEERRFLLKVGKYIIFQSQSDLLTKCSKAGLHTFDIRNAWYVD